MSINKKYILPIILLLIALFIAIVMILLFIVSIGVALYIPESSLSLDEHRALVKELINQNYPDYNISSIELQYTDWSSTIRTADENHTPKKALVLIEKEDNQIDVYCEMHMNKWYISESIPKSGSLVPNDVYFAEFRIENIGKAANMDELIKERKYWIITGETGKGYTKINSGSDWYYSLKHCENLYKTVDGKVYQFNKDTNDWEISDIPYSNLVHYANYTEITKDYALEILRKYSSYTGE